MESVTVDGHEGRILGFCGVPPAPQIEATFVVDKRAYLFTLYDGREAPNEQEARALFDRLMTTTRSIQRARWALRSQARPERGRQSGNASGPRSLSSRASPWASSAGSHEYG